MRVFLFFIFCFNNVFSQRLKLDTSFIINNQNFKIQVAGINDEQDLLSVYRNSKLIKLDSIDADGLFKFPDFNKDGAKDLLLIIPGNNDAYYLYLFDKIKNEFHYVEGFDRFPASVQLKKNSKYYYSYHRAGCADFDWVSDLFYIENFKCILIGHIYGQGCDSDPEDPPIIEIYKIFDNNEANQKLFLKLPYQKNIPVFGYKWTFIKKYWEKNYSKFTSSLPH